MIEEDDNKKTEKLEVRLSYEEKQKLKAEAETRAMSVSDLVRNILKQSPQRSHLARKKPNRFGKILPLLIGIMIVAGSATWVLTQKGSQTPIIVQLEGIIERDVLNGRVSSQFNSVFELRLNEPGSVAVPPGADSKDNARLYHVVKAVLSESNTQLVGASSPTYSLSIDIIEVQDGEREVVHSPYVLLGKDSTGRYTAKVGERTNYEVTASMK